ncbi:centrosomin [Condylostylus longicornis]|uniref:centrosomin n=1 Tax=Condylostylus longicornis TaxID=2530218 RepID=UPI00244E345C|nr:centrosomin [Condylostylus longicornis]
MSGIFRYNSSSSTPDKRWTISPFCVSPGQLQDMTTENHFSFGSRSPFFTNQNNGSTSPSQGRSVREFEEQMATLRKENFNLKLRIYFLEEKIPGLSQMNTPEGQESLMKQYIDNKVDTEMLRKDLEEKQQLLKEAADALTHMENIQKETEMKNQQIIDELNQRIQILELEDQSANHFLNNDETIMNDLMGRTNLDGDNIDMIQKVRELEGSIKVADDKIKELTIHLKELEETVAERDKTIERLETSRKELNFQNLELKEVLDSKQQINVLKIRGDLDRCRSQLADKMCEVDELQEKLNEKNLAYEKAVVNIEKLVHTIKSLKSEIEQLRKPSSFKISVNKELLSSMNKSLSDSECFYFKDSLDESWAKKLILNDPTKNSTEKIENIDSIVLDDEFKLPSSLSESEISKGNLSNQELTAIEDDLKIFKSNSFISKLQAEIKEAKEDADKANKWRRECSDVCVILTARLEELAGFLDSLLKHKEILNAVASERRRAMRKAVDKSLDLSRSLTAVTLPGLSLNNSSLANISNITNILDNTGNLQNNNALLNSTQINDEIISRLKSEANGLKHELEKNTQTTSKEINKKERRSILSSYHLDQSESETWSEPDRNVSLARIGLEESLNTLSKAKKLINRDEPASETSINKTRSSSSTENNDLGRKSKSNIKDRISQYEQLILMKDNKILEIQCELLEADNRLKKESLKLAETNQKLNEYRINNEIMEVELTSLKNQALSLNILKTNEENLRLELQNKTAQLNKIQDERNQLTIEVRVAETHIENLKAEINNLKQQHEKHIQSLQNSEKERLTQMHKQLQDLLKENLKELELKHQEAIERDWISRQVYNDAKKEIDKLEKKLTESENTIEYLNENEIELKNHLIENEKSVRAMRKTLDETTLSVSKAILERTKAINEKLKFEAKVQELTNELESVLKEKNILEDKLRVVNNHCGYTSEEINVIARSGEPQGNQRLENSSPDLGIDSDTGRQSNAEEKETSPENEETELIVEDNVNNNNRNQQSISLSQILTIPSDHDCSQVYKENFDLKAKLKRTIRQYEETLKRLRTANQLKEQVERDIRQQLHKTNVVLKNVRTNIETNLENIHKKNQ